MPQLSCRSFHAAAFKPALRIADWTQLPHLIPEFGCSNHAPSTRLVSCIAEKNTTKFDQKRIRQLSSIGLLKIFK